MVRLENRFSQGCKDSIPIGLGYLSVSFTFGMAAVSGGIPLEVAIIISLTNLTSAGQFSALTLIIEQASLLELALSQFIINLRYALMSLSLSQKVDKKMKTYERALISFGITDEIFALSSSRYEQVGKWYMLGLMAFPIFCWTFGTFLGGAASRVLPLAIRDALGIAIYGMFLAIIIPPARKMKAIRNVLLLSIILSCSFALLHDLLPISSGFVVILCTVVASAVGAWLFPLKEDDYA